MITKPVDAMVPTPAVLSALSAELQHAVELCESLEALVAKLIGGVAGEPLELALREAQAVDVLTQHLSALAAFTHALAEHPAGQSAHDLSEALARINLADLAARLHARARNLDGPAVADSEAGELQLF